MLGWDIWKKGFEAWGGATARYIEHVMKAKAATDEAVASYWGAVGLSTRRDQERTLHALNQIQCRLMDLEEKLAEKK